ncbi:unnamed protein product [Natator depressus]
MDTQERAGKTTCTAPPAAGLSPSPGATSKARGCILTQARESGNNHPAAAAASGETRRRREEPGAAAREEPRGPTTSGPSPAQPFPPAPRPRARPRHAPAARRAAWQENPPNTND